MVKILALLMSLCFLMSFVGCGTRNTSSKTDDVYGDAVDYEDEDDDVNGTTSKVATQKDSSGSSAVNTDGKTKKANADYGIDEKEKKAFLETIPSSLKGQTVKILIWWNAGVAETAKMKEFTEKTGINVKFITTGADTYYQKLSSMINQGNSPDLACIQQSNFPACLMQDYFLPLSSGKFDLSDPIYDIDTMNQFKYADKYYGAMVKGSTMVTMYFLAYNSDMFKKAQITTPNELWQQGKWNWNTFVSTCQEIMSKTPGLKAAVTGEYQCNYLVQTAGTDPVKYVNGKLVNNTSDTTLVKAWQFINDLKDKYKICDPGLNNQGFYDGSSAMCVMGNYSMQKGDTLEKKMVYNWGFAPLPCPEGNGFTISSSAKLWGLPKGTKNAEAASYALRYWLDSTYDVKGYETWVNDSVAQFNAWMWEQPKTYSFYTGVVDYGGNYSWSTMTAKLAGAGADNVKSELDSWSKVIDANITKIYKEFG